MAPRGALGAVMALCCGLAACDAPPTLELREWTLAVGSAHSSVTLPTRLDDGRVPASPMTYELVQHVALPPALRGQPLQLVIPDFGAHVVLRVDGEEAVALDTEGTDAYRGHNPHAWAIPADGTTEATLDLDLVVAHAWTQSAWWGTVPRLLPAGRRDRAATEVYVFNFLISGAALIALCQVGFASLLVYFADRRRRAYLPFGLQGLIAAVYPMFVAGWTQPVLGVYDTPALAISLALAATVSIHFTHDFFGLTSRPWRGFWWLCGAVCAVAIVFRGPFEATRIAGLATVVYVSIVLVHQLITCARLVRRGHEPRTAMYLLVSWLGLAVAAAPDFTWWLGQGALLGGVRLASIGLAFFAVRLSLLLSQKHIHSLRKSDALNAELEQRVHQLELHRSEIELLNNELRRQIADRASQIYAAIALAKTRSRAAALQVGDVVQGRYRVERAIGAGGMGTIYEVTRLTDHRRFALKLPQEVHGESLARLAREAQIASTLAHPNIVAVVDVDVATGGFLFLVMELVEGSALNALKARYGETAWALRVLHQIAEGLTALHRVGIVHRDLKPANVLITETPADGVRAKIADFGISLQPEIEQLLAHDADEPTTDLDDETTHVEGARKGPSPAGQLASSSFLTRTGHIPGTPVYMAPEVIEGRGEITGAADMFAFGVIAHELLAKKRPFTEPPVLALVARRACPLPTALAEAWPACPRELARAVDACLSIDPALRPTPAEVARILATTLAI